MDFQPSRNNAADSVRSEAFFKNHTTISDPRLLSDLLLPSTSCPYLVHAEASHSTHNTVVDEIVSAPPQGYSPSRAGEHVISH